MNCNQNGNLICLSLFVSLFVLLKAPLVGQTFTDVPLSVSKSDNCSAVLFDYDADGDLDICYSSPLRIFENNAGAYTTVLSGSSYTDVYAFDSNNDNYMDFVVTGTPSKLYIYQSATKDYTTVDLINATNNNVCAGDLDNDGDQDLIISGEQGETVSLFLFRNDGGNSFVEVYSEVFTAIHSGSIKIVDYNNDQVNDIFLSGVDRNGNPISYLYKNLSDFNFTKIHTFSSSRYYPDSDVADINGDGLIDFAQAGWQTHYGAIQTSDNQFSEQTFTSENIRDQELCLLNYDNDGDYDIIVSGSSSPNKTFFVTYDNNIFTSTLVEGYSAYRSSMAVGDIDNDNDVDIFMSGYQGAVPMVKILRNDHSVANKPPSIPKGLSVDRDGIKYFLRWNKATDDQTPSVGLSYNVCVGTTSGGTEVVSPESDTSNGKRYIHRIGNAGVDTIFMLSGLAPGNYYWKVQSIDNCGVGSSFSSIVEFTVQENFRHETIQPVSVDMHLGDIELLDYDKDNDLDIVIMGYDHYMDGTMKDSSFAFILENNNGTFSTNFAFNFKQNTIYDIKIADFNNNNFPDIFLAGNISRLLLNNKKKGYLETINYSSSSNYLIAGGDINNDGFYDLVYGNRRWHIHNGNLNNPELNIDNSLPSGHAITNTFDFNNDRRIDYFASGKIYKNNDGQLNQVGDLGFLSSGTMFPSDIDGDNDLDIIYNGWIGEVRHTEIYLNNGNSVFEHLDQNDIRKAKGTGFPADFDNDGNIDLFVGGYSSEYISELYLNQGNLEFELFDFNFNRTLDRNKIVFGDIDNDSDLDIILIENSLVIHIYYNNYSSINTGPDAPTGLSSNQIGNGIELFWNSSGDDHTNSQSLTYNVRIGSIPGGTDIVSPLSDGSGKRFIVEPGNAFLNTSYIIDYLPPGQYYWSVQAIDGSYEGGKWSKEQTFTITVIAADFEADTVCMGDITHFTDISVTGGTEITAWDWDFGDGSTSKLQHPTHVYKESGSYSVQLVAIGGEHSNSITKTVIVKPVPIASFSANDVCIGTATAFTNTTKLNGTTINSWLWNFGDGITSSDQSPSDHSYNVGAYNVELIAVADNECSDASVKQVQVGAYPSENISLIGNTDFCLGDSTILTVENNALYSYTWKLNSVPIAGEVNDSIIIKNNSGSYNAEIVNAVGSCVTNSAITPITIDPIPVSPFISVSAQTTFCEGDSIKLSVDYNSELTYQWKLNGGAIGADSNLIYVKESGSYDLEIVNLTGCEAVSSNTIEVTVNENPTIPAVSVNGLLEFCEGDSVELITSYNASLLYQWEKDGFNITDATDTSYVIYNAGDYLLSVENSFGCSNQTQSFNVTINPNPATPNINLSGQVNFCNGDSVVLSVENNAQNSYRWLLGTGDLGGTLNEWVAKISGSYNIEVKNSFECIANSLTPVEINVYDNPVLSELSLEGTELFCQGDYAILGVVNNPDYNYQWRKTGTVLANENNDTLKVTSSGDYSLIATNSNNCSSETKVKSIEVLATPVAPVIEANSSLVFCEGDSVVLNVTENPDYTYQWKLNGGAVGTNSSSFIANTSGVYNVIVSNDAGCVVQSINSIEVIVNPTPSIPTVSVSGQTEFCSGESIILNITENPDYTYQWKNGIADIPDAVDDSLLVTESGGYYLLITNAEGCTSKTPSQEVTVNASPDSPTIIMTGPTSFCSGNSITLSVDSNPDYTYQWRLNGGTIGSDGNSLVVKTSGTYDLFVSKADGCSSNSTDSVVVEVYETPTISELSIVGENEFCSGSSVTFSLTYNSDYSYQWYKNGGLLPNEITNSIEATESGTYSLSVSNAYGCLVQSNSETVTVNSAPPVPIINTSGVTSFCKGDSVVLTSTANADYTYKWLVNGAEVGANENSFTAKNSGSYMIEVVNNSNCSMLSTDTVKVTVNELPTMMSISPSGQSTICNGDSIKFRVESEEGYVYQWKNSLGIITDANAHELYAKTTDSYYLEIINASACMVITEPVNILVKESPDRPLIIADGATKTCSGSKVKLTSTYVNGYNYQWQLNGGNFGADTNSFEAELSGTYALQITNSEGCTALSNNEVVISHYEKPQTPELIVEGQTSFCEGDSIKLVVEMPDNYSLQWLKYAEPYIYNKPDIYIKTTGDYTAQFTNTDGCKSEVSDKIEINVLETPGFIGIDYETADICEGETVTLLLPEQSGYSYSWYKNNEEIATALTYELKVEESGSYHAVVSNSNNCSSTAEGVNITVSAMPNEQSLQASGNLEICLGEMVELSVNYEEGFTYIWTHNGDEIADVVGNTYSAADEGRYAVSIANVNNASCSHVTTGVDLEHKPSLPAPTLLAEGSSTWVLACDNPDAAIYRWYYNGDLIPGEDEYIHVAGEKLGDYYVTVSDGGECHVPSDIITIPLNATGITDVETVFGEIKIYPNPTPGLFTIEMNNQIIGTLYIRIVNESGKELFNIKHNKTTKHLKTQMDLSGQGDGIYFIEFRFEGDRVVRKVVVE